MPLNKYLSTRRLVKTSDSFVVSLANVGSSPVFPGVGLPHGGKTRDKGDPSCHAIRPTVRDLFVYLGHFLNQKGTITEV